MRAAVTSPKAWWPNLAGRLIVSDRAFPAPSKERSPTGENCCVDRPPRPGESNVTAPWSQCDAGLRIARVPNVTDR